MQKSRNGLEQSLNYSRKFGMNVEVQQSETSLEKYDSLEGL